MRPLFVVLALIVAWKVGEQLYRYVAFRDERTAMAAMRVRLVDAGAEVVRTRLRADSLRTQIEQADLALDARKRRVDGYGRFADGGALPEPVYERYRVDLRRFNQDVAARNAMLDLYHAIIGRNRVVTARYNVLADSMEALAERMGNAFYAVPRPVEAAAERGVIPMPR